MLVSSRCVGGCGLLSFRLSFLLCGVVWERERERESSGMGMGMGEENRERRVGRRE